MDPFIFKQFQSCVHKFQTFFFHDVLRLWVAACKEKSKKHQPVTVTLLGIINPAPPWPGSESR